MFAKSDYTIARQPRISGATRRGSRPSSRSFVLCQFVVLLLGCARPNGEAVTPRESTGFVAALNGLPLDSICGDACEAIKVDTMIRWSPTLLMHYPLRDSIVAVVRNAELRELDLQDKALVATGSWYDPREVPDTLRAAAYFVGSLSPSSASRELGVVLFPPNQPLQTWRVLITWDGRAWKASEMALHFVP